jgi:hypothetical protein
LVLIESLACEVYRVPPESSGDKLHVSDRPIEPPGINLQLKLFFHVKVSHWLARKEWELGIVARSSLFPPGSQLLFSHLCELLSVHQVFESIRSKDEPLSNRHAVIDPLRVALNDEFSRMET